MAGRALRRRRDRLESEFDAMDLEDSSTSLSGTSACSSYVAGDVSDCPTPLRDRRFVVLGGRDPPGEIATVDQVPRIAVGQIAGAAPSDDDPACPPDASKSACRAAEEMPVRQLLEVIRPRVPHHNPSAQRAEEHRAPELVGERECRSGDSGQRRQPSQVEKRKPRNHDAGRFTGDC
jgi:hypothetical protein